MPITAKLSRQFYEKLGDEVTNELVTWLNAVDDSYRHEFKELFAANFGRVEAEMARLRAEIDVKLAQLRVDIGDKIGRLVWWMLGFWVAQVAVTISAIVAVRQLLH